MKEIWIQAVRESILYVVTRPIYKIAVYFSQGTITSIYSHFKDF